MQVLDKVFKGHVSSVGACFGAVAGLVGITPMAGFVPVTACFVVGSASAIACYLAMRAQAQSSVDDTLDVFACHGVGGPVGILLGSLLGRVDVNPLASAALRYEGVCVEGALWGPVGPCGGLRCPCPLTTHTRLAVVQLTRPSRWDPRCPHTRSLGPLPLPLPCLPPPPHTHTPHANPPSTSW